MSFPKAQKKTLKNGLRVIAVPMKNAPTVTVQVFVEVGAHYEEKRLNGLSHFLEHMMFKGTPKRPTAHIITTELDSLGAQNNAYTGDVMTSYYAKGRSEHFEKLFDIVADLFLNPLLPAVELEKERGVIIEEINMYEDMPQRKVHDVLEALLYDDQAAGRPIIGPKENIRRFTRNDFVKYRKAHYVPSKTIVVVAGGVSAPKIFATSKKYFEKVPAGRRIVKPKIKEVQKQPEVLHQEKKTGQSHLAFGFRGFGAGDSRIASATVLAAVLGKGMSSRLFQKLREEMGVCYYARSGFDTSTDVGAFKITAGVDTSRLKEVVAVIMEEVRKILKEGVSKEELAKAKEMIIGSIEMGLESSDAFAEWYGGDEILRKKLETPEQAIAHIRKVTLKDVHKVAQDLFKEKGTNLAIIGPKTDTVALKKLLTL